MRPNPSAVALWRTLFFLLAYVLVFLAARRLSGDTLVAAGVLAAVWLLMPSNE